MPHCNTTHQRLHHTSAVHGGKILLVGGSASPTTTEWVNMDGSGELGFPLQSPGRQNHCSITLESPVPRPRLLILTGGKDTGALVTQYSLPNGDNAMSMPDLIEPRENHACGVYQTSEGSQVDLDFYSSLQTITSSFHAGTDCCWWFRVRTGQPFAEH